MNQLLVIFSCLTFAVCTNALPDFYWRSCAFDELVPPTDAVLGPELCGRKTFLANVPLDGYGRVFGRYLENARDVKVTEQTNGEDTIYSIKKDLQILCSPTPEKFIWVETTSDTINEVQGYLVPGGHDGSLHYIGQVDDIIGKVSNENGNYELVYVNKFEGSVERSQSFSVLVYKE